MTNVPFPPQGLHPHQVLALREHKGLSQDEFGAMFGVAGHQVDRWEAEGLSTGPIALAVRAVAHAWGFSFPALEATGNPCTICNSDAYHVVLGLEVCRACYLTPIESMRGMGYVVSIADENTDVDIEIKAPRSRQISLPPAMFGPEDWKTAVRKLRTTEHQTGFADFDDLVFIAYIEPETTARLKDETIRHIIEDLVPHGDVELIGDAARMDIFRRNQRPESEIVLRLGLLMARLCENA